MKGIIFIILLFFTSPAFTQGNVVRIDCDNYTSYFDTIIKQPLVVSYSLYKGGGPCSRAGFAFKNDRKNIRTATTADYAHSGYDRGHLANAEDFAYDCRLDELTFRYYNCIPQSKILNRGIWKDKESVVRDMSQKDTVKVICFAKDFKKDGNLYVPAICGKIVIEKGGKITMWVFDQNGSILPSDPELLKKYLLYSK